MIETELSKLSGRYLAALRAHFKQEAHASLLAAHELGTQAVTIGLETLDLAKIHDKAFKNVLLPGRTSIKRAAMTTRAADFFSEAIKPIENTHRAALQTGARLHRVSQTLERRTKAVADSQRELRQQITERKTAEATLKVRTRTSNQLLTKSRLLEKNLQDSTHRVLFTNEGMRKKMSLQLHDEIAQALVGIHVRLLALKKEAAASNALFSKEIATTQRLVTATVKTINRFAREFGGSHET